MATKWKRYNIWLKLSAFVLASVCFAYGLQTLLLNGTWFYQGYGEMDVLASAEYTETSAFQRDLQSLHNVVSSLADMPGREAIAQGETVTRERLENRKQNLFREKRDLLARQIQIELGASGSTDDFILWSAFEEKYAEEIDALPAKIIAEDLEQYDSLLSELTRRPEVTFFIPTTGGILSNTGYVPENSYWSLPYVYEGYRTGAAIAYDPDYMLAKNNEFLKYAADAQYLLGVLCTMLAVCLLCFVYLVYAAGRKSADGQVHLLFIDKLYGEFAAALLCLTIAAVIGLGDMMVRYKNINERICYVLLLLLGMIGLSLIVSFVRRGKSRTLWKQTLVYAVCLWLFRPIRDIYRAGSLSRKTAAAVIVFGILTMIPFAGFITIPAAVWLMHRKARAFAQIQEGAAAIQNGRYTEEIKVEGNGEFQALAASLTEIAAGLNTEVEHRLKAERLKTELISNVSHDIRTPLTSVITYVDLLKGEQTDNENIQKYVDVIDQKANRLRQLTDDLFEASKAASGNIPVSWERVDVASLLRQGLGELDDRVQASGLDFKVHIPDDKLYARADGKHLWRVMENLFSNVFKYALNGSRVYVTAFARSEDICVEIKNISAFELNIDEAELMERFKRGDDARSDGGSGLGLSIAKSLMLSQNGRLHIQIDGDLFKATIYIPIWQEKSL